nr:NAD(+) synthase [Vicinamibacterales bacterium]
MRMALLQLNPTVGALEANAGRIERAVRAAAGVDLCVTPEMSLVGYPARDLLLQRAFVVRAGEVLERLAASLATAPPVLVGVPMDNPAPNGRPLFNAAALLRGGRVERWFRKSLLPTYDVFDEDRYFEPGPGSVGVLEVGGTDAAVSVCEDIWNDRDFWKRRRYHRDPVEEARAEGADLLINMSASPFAAGKQTLRERMIGSLARRHGLPVLYVNQVGGNDDLVFDGRSLFVDRGGEVRARARAFAEDTLVVDTSDLPDAPVPPLPEEAEEIVEALVLGTRDYARKCGFRHALLGLSGGIDSALTAAIAVRALGASNVRGVLMPSPYSSAGSVDDSLALAARLGIETMTLPIAPIMDAFARTLAGPLAGSPEDTTEENIQARIRGNL